MTQALIGIDIGTTNIKAMAFTPDGRTISQVSTPTLTHYPRPDWAYYKPKEIWDAICGTLYQLCQSLPEDVEPAAFAATSMAESAIPIDRDGQPVYDAIAWFDRRTQSQVDWWKANVGEEIVSSITGASILPIFGINKLMWIRDNEPDIFSRIDRWLNMTDYAAYRLCGVAATDYSLASRMMVLDVAKRAWSDPLLDAAQVPSTLFGELVQSGTLLGHVHAEAAAQTGLPEGLPVVSGGHDHVCGAFALGMVEQGDVLDSMGTSESIFFTTEKPQLEPETVQVGFAQGVHVVPNRTYMMGGLYTSGAAVGWITDILSQPESRDYEELIEQAGAAPPGSGGIFFIPHLRMGNPPHTDPMARGSFIGLTTDAKRGHLARAVIEGIAYEAYTSYLALTEALAVTPQRTIAIGGGTSNRLLMNIKATLAGFPYEVASVQEATCLGAAMLAGVGAGLYRSHIDAVEQIQYSTYLVKPDPKFHSFYQTRYHDLYAKIYPTLKELNQIISTKFVA